jgi:transglutaminase-like putative cysteine protease
VFAELARERGFDVQLVTGYRADGARMVRHRWAIAHTSAGWVSVDPTWGEAPIAAGAVVALAVHGDSAREIGIADELAFQGLSDARARYVDRLSVPPCARSTARTPRSSR